MYTVLTIVVVRWNVVLKSVILFCNEIKEVFSEMQKEKIITVTTNKCVI